MSQELSRQRKRIRPAAVAVLLLLGCSVFLGVGTWLGKASPASALPVRTTTTFKIVPRPTYTTTTPPVPSTSPSTSTTSGPATSTTTSTDPSPTSTTVPLPEPTDVRTVDVVIYGTTTSGIGALRGLQLARAAYPGQLTVAIIGGGPHMESTIAQGLAVEDLYGSNAASGFYREFRDAVIAEYAARGINAVPGGRLTVEPEVAAGILRWYVDYNGRGRPNVTFVQGRLLQADDREERYVLVKNGSGVVRINTRYFIDASPEGDLARMLGADYMIGRSEDVYNDLDGRRAPRPSRDNDWATSPQSMSILLTLKIYQGAAPSVADLDHPSYNPLTYGPDFKFSEWARAAFATSWTMRYVLPNNKRELNEAWGDYSNPDTSYDWVMYPEKRAELRATIQNWILNKVRYLQEHGYPQVGVATVPTRPYVRDGVRILGLTVYTQQQILAEQLQEPVAYGAYALWDRHDTIYGSRQDSRPGYVHVPMGALMAQGHPYLLMSTAVSTDSLAQCSAVRMEPVRANMGGAAGIIVAIAAWSGTSPQEVPYSLVRRELQRQGYFL